MPATPPQSGGHESGRLLGTREQPHNRRLRHQPDTGGLYGSNIVIAKLLVIAGGLLHFRAGDSLINQWLIPW
jgi:hypothetical protein